MSTYERDDALRAACFAHLSMLRGRHGDQIPYRGALDAGFPFRGGRIPFLTPYKGIFRAAAQRGQAALSVNTSFDSPYADRVTPDGFVYAYRAGSPDQPDNVALRVANRIEAPIVYFVGTRPGWYEALFPFFVALDDESAREVVLSPGELRGSLDDPHPAMIDDPIQRSYAVREARVRVHQPRFRARVLPAYRNQCAICTLKEPRLLDAAHIVPDADERGEPRIANGISLCSIHHKAYDELLVGISPDYAIEVSRRLLEDEDGPMLELLKGFHHRTIVVPRTSEHRPEPALLAVRYDRFRDAG